MVVVGGDAVLAEELGGLGRAPSVAHIDNARAGIALHNAKHPAQLVVLLHDKIGKVVAFEALLEHIALFEAQPQLDVLHHLRGGGGGEGQHRHLREDLA